ncbi:S-layer homology domain-containing protein [Paenibacillus elgii]|uniref:S-layer homology domain-containing protein n=1 Tax=Paenibacillus elgii TaxID=189691 RepID=UPI0013D7467E|nr:S-layer homology domain-containing protein [Paenibacillus elgii]
MKKSLSAILSLAMAFSMFSSVALGADAKKSSADFTDLKDLDAATKAKFDEMIGAGIFDGVKEGTFGLKDKMNRAQFAKVAALVFNLKVDTSLKTSSFSDVKSDDPANGYALPYIEAVKAAGITDGYAPGQFNPAGDVTKEQLATFLIRGLNKDSEGKNKTGVSDKTVSDWAKGYVALALELKLLSNGTDGTFGGTSAATRDLLVTSSYEAKKQFVDTNKPAKASVKEVKAVDYNKVQVTLDRDVDTDKATFVLKKGTAETKYEARDKDVKWSEDKKVATLTLKDGAKIVEDTYSVTLGGLDASSVDVVTKEFKGEIEKLTKIDFVTANDTIAKSKKVRVQIKPTNQYGQLASFTPGSYTVNVPSPDNNASIKKSSDGTKMYVELTTDGPNVYSGSSTVSINIWSNDYRDISATKVFKIGEYPYVAKVELGAVTYTNNKTAIQASGDKAVVKMTQYDQYGGEITVDSGSLDRRIQDPSAQLIPKGNTVVDNNLGQPTVEDDDGDGVKEVIVKTDKKITGSGEYTLQVYGGGSTASATVKVSASKIATKVEFGEFSKKNLANGDKDIYLDLIAYDADGAKLTADEIVDNVKDKRFNISVNGPLVADATTDVPASMLDADKKVVLSGENKGKIHFAKVDGKASGSVWIYIQGIYGSDTNKNKSYSTVDARYPVTIKTIEEAPNKAVAGADVKPKYQLIDNYQEVLKEMPTDKINENGKTVSYDVYATVKANGVSATLTTDNGTVVKDGDVIPMKQFSDKELKIATDSNTAVGGTYEVKFAIRKTTNNGNPSEETSTTKKVTIVNPTSEDLKYSLSAIGDLFKTIDDGTYGSDQNDITNSKLAKEVKVIAKDSAGNVIAYPKRILDVTADTYSVARTAAAANKGYIIGNKTGTSNVTARFYDAKGEIKIAQGTVTVKGDAIQIASMERDDASKTISLAAGTVIEGWKLMGNLTLKDQYGDEFKNENIIKYDKITSLRYTISDATKVGDKSVAELAADLDKIKINGKGAFTLTATTANGRSVTTTVVIN